MSSPGADLGTARGKIVIDTADAEKAGERVKDSIDDVTKKQASSADSWKRGAQTSALVYSGAVVGAFALAANAAANFDQKLANIAAVGGAEAEASMDAIRAKALQLGADTKFSATEAAAAMEELVKAGVSVEDILGGAADAAVNLAAAAGDDVGVAQAAEIAANSMAMFGLAAKDLTGVVDLIAGAANASTIGVNDFAQSLNQVGGVANLVGATFNDTATAIALMGKMGIKGSDAGTSLKTMLLNLQPQTKEQIKLAKELGIVTANGTNNFFDQTGKLKSLADIAGVLNTATKGMTDAQKTAALEVLFGSDAIRAAAIVTEAGAEGFAAMNAEMRKVTAAEVAAKRMDSLKGQIEQMKGSLETTAIIIGTAFIPVLRQLAGWIGQAANWFGSLPEPMRNAIVTALLVSAGLAGMSVAIYKIVKAVKIAIPVIKAVALAIKAFSLSLLANPVFLIIAAIVLLVAGLVLLYRNSETARRIMNAMWAGIRTAVAATVNWLVNTAWPFIQRVWDGIVTGAQAVWSFLVAVWNGIKATISAVINFISAYISTNINFWRTVIQTVLGVIMGIWNAFWGLFGGVIKAAFGVVVALVQLAMAVIALYIRTAVDIIQVVWGALWGFVQWVWGAIVGYITWAVNGVLSIIQAVWGKIGEPITSALNAIWSFIVNIFSRISAFIMGALNTITGVMSSAWNTARNAVSGPFNAMRDTVSNAISSIINIMSGLAGRIISAVGNLGSILYNAGRDIILGMIRGIESMLNALRNKINAIKDMLPGSPVKEGPLRVLNRAPQLLAPHGRQLVAGLAAAIASEIPSLEAQMVAMQATVSPLTARSGDGLALANGRPIYPSTPAPRSTAGADSGPVTVNNYYPLPETASDATERTMRKISLERSF